MRGVGLAGVAVATPGGIYSRHEGWRMPPYRMAEANGILHVLPRDINDRALRMGPRPDAADAPRELALLVEAGRAALDDSGRRSSELHAIGCYVGTGSAGAYCFAELFSEGQRNPAGIVSARRSPYSSFSAAAAELALRLGLTGPTLTVTSGRGSALDVLVQAAMAIHDGEARAILAASVEILEDPATGMEEPSAWAGACLLTTGVPRSIGSNRAYGTLTEAFLAPAAMDVREACSILAGRKQAPSLIVVSASCAASLVEISHELGAWMPGRVAAVDHRVPLPGVAAVLCGLRADPRMSRAWPLASSDNDWVDGPLVILHVGSSLIGTAWWPESTRAGSVTVTR